jgi:phosphoglycerate dehydrogenase-like enzyme
MSKPRITVLFVIDIPPGLREHLQRSLAKLESVSTLFPDSMEETELAKLAPQADVIVGWRIPPAVLQAAKRLAVLVFPGVGVQRLITPLRKLNERRLAEGAPAVTLVKCVSNTYATAQHAVALLLALMNKVVPHHNWMAEGLWRRGDDYAESVPLRSRHVGLLGYGQVNSKVHRFLSGFDVDFGILKRSWRDQVSELPTDVERFDQAKLYSFLDWADVLIAALPETSSTRSMIGANELAALGSEGLLVNIGRGAIVEEAALYTALRSKTIAGAAIDVWYDYRPDGDTDGRKFPCAPEHPFHELENVVLSPHRAASPVFAAYRWVEVVEHIERYAGGEPALHVVDLHEEY